MSMTQMVPPRATVEITPSDSTEYNDPFRFIWVGIGGSVFIKLENDSGFTELKNVPNGAYIYGMVTGIGASTSASSIVGFL